jgi:hypothetical protein
MDCIVSHAVWSLRAMSGLQNYPQQLEVGVKETSAKKLRGVLLSRTFPMPGGSLPRANRSGRQTDIKGL